MTNGLFEVLAGEDASTQERLVGTRAVIAVQTRAKDRFETFVSKAKNQEERDARVAVISADLDEIVRSVADEYGVEDVGRLHNAATVALGGGHPSNCTCGFCKNKGKLPGAKKDDDSDSDSDDDGDSNDKSDASDDKDKDDDKGKKKMPWESSVQVRQTTASAAPYDWERVAAVHEADGFSHCDCSCDGCDDGNHCESEECIATKHSGNGGNPASAGSSEKTAAGKTCPECEKGQMRKDDHVWICPKCDYETSEPDDDDDDTSTKTAADTETGDTFTAERVDLPASKDGLGGPSPKIDKANSGDNLGWSLPEIDVPSKQHPEEKQQIHESPDYKADLPGVSETGKSIDADAPLQPEFNVADNTDTWTGTEGQANPVTSATFSKWQVIP